MVKSRKDIEALEYHSQGKPGKIEVVPTKPYSTQRDLSLAYSPGVAIPCTEIAENKEDVYKYTAKGNLVAVISNGTAVLGLGDIGPEAGMPVMEGKALLFKYLGGVDAVPVCLDTKDPDEIIRTVKLLQPSFGGINLEDISNPKCFRILDTLRKEMDIPVWHDDQQGTAAVTLAGLINALKIVGKKKEKVKVAMIGIGAANVAILRVMFIDGFKPSNTIVVDSKAILHTGRDDLEQQQKENPYKWDLCQKTNPEKVTGGIAEALKGADICVSLSKSGPDVIRPEWIKAMAKNSIVFVCANPIPEIWPWEAKEAGAKIVATGRSDFPNQINNSTGFPAIFRGALDVRATTITDEMCIAAAYELAQFAEDRGINEENISPTMSEWEVFVREAVAVGMKAQEQGVARLTFSREELTDKASKIIKETRDITAMMMKEGFIPKSPR